MKKSEFVKKALKHRLNTVFGCEGTVERAIDMFEDLGMLPPERDDESPIGYGAAYLTEEEYVTNRFKFKHTWESDDE
jgi:hypothetical protein